MPHTIASFNVNNLFVRYRFGRKFPGDRSPADVVEDATLGFLPVYDPDLMLLFNPEQRELAAKVITRDGTGFPDIVCLQEVESLIALRRFNEVHLGGAYKYALLIDSRDFRQIDVGILSNVEIRDVRSHVDDLDPTPDNPLDPWLFSRDCLEIEFDLGSRQLTLFVNHLKSKYAETMAERQRGDALRLRQATAVAAVLRDRFPGNRYDSAFFAVIGDLNDDPGSAALAPLMDDAGLEDALERINPVQERWTHWWRGENQVSQLDQLLLSPALAAATAGSVPHIERRGISFARTLNDGGSGPRLTHFHRVEDDPNPIDVDFRFVRFPQVTPKAYASDHCALFFEVP